MFQEFDECIKNAIALLKELHKKYPPKTKTKKHQPIYIILQKAEIRSMKFLPFVNNKVSYSTCTYEMIEKVFHKFGYDLSDFIATRGRCLLVKEPGHLFACKFYIS
jgi:hypothetical protein